MSGAELQPGRIYYFCKFAHGYTMGVFVGDYPNSVADAVRIVPYERLRATGSFEPGAFIFTDFDRLSPAETALAQRFYEAIGEQNPALPRLNDPRRVLPRFELLRALHAAGLNSFNVYRVPERHEIQHFPVFIRWGSDHRMPLTKLIAHADLLESTLTRLAPEVRDDPDLMIVEFGNAPDTDGHYRKYSAYRVGDYVYGQHCFTSKSWFIKFTGLEWGDAERAFNAEYVATNPHAGELKKYFDVAGIEYGRADYCVVDGRIQMFEINTNPLIIAERGREDLAPYAALHDTAMRTLLVPRPGPGVRVPDDARRAVDDLHAEVLSVRHDPHGARSSVLPPLTVAR